MMKQQKPPGTYDFTTFVEGLQRNLATAQEAPRRDPTRLLSILRSGPKSVPELMKATGMGTMDFLEVLKTLQDVGLVVLQGAAGQEQAELTPNGRQVAELKAE